FRRVLFRSDSGCCCFPPFSARQLRRNHFAAAIGLAPPRRLPRSLWRSRDYSASSDDPPVARRPRNAVTLPPAVPAGTPNRQHRVIFVEPCYWTVRRAYLDVPDRLKQEDTRTL